jgi:hypothetical protein
MYSPHPLFLCLYITFEKLKKRKVKKRCASEEEKTKFNLSQTKNN